jgi:hypothetical protein
MSTTKAGSCSCLLRLIICANLPKMVCAFPFCFSTHYQKMEAEQIHPRPLVLWGPTYTMNPNAPWAEAVVVVDGRIAYVGTKALPPPPNQLVFSRLQS